ncbi:lipopolysaccharide biosynthesis protein [uncultured Roseibium sp.]|uniref:lipopolysaccharide biosynthesis protein n=1 Tax=uncultured Roseibium sp. TaxID=1936171 RepID=UPI0025985819|nr:lipopolysaccharide biosynthesis protein [uncultured Roseibium sp.]
MASFISSSAFSTMAGVVSLIFGFTSSIVVARMLGAEGTGSVAFAIWVAMTVATLANCGVPSILLRYMPAFDTVDRPGGGLARLLFPRFALPVTLTIFGLAAYALWLQNAGGDNEHPPSLWLMTALLLFSYSLAAFGEAAARGLTRFDEAARFAFYGCLLQLPLVALGGYFFGAAGAVAGHIARHLPQALRTIFYVRQVPTENTKILPKMNSYGWNTWFSNAVGMLVWSRSEFLFLGIYYSATELGYYAAGLTLAGLVIQLPTHMIAGLTPHIGRHHDNDDIDQINRTYQRVMRWLCLFILPICFGGAAIMGQLLPLLFGDDFHEAVDLSIILVAFAFLTALSLVPSTFIGARERSDFYLYASPIMALLSMGAFAAITPFWGPTGTAWARTGVHGLWLIWLVYFCWKKLDIRLDILGLAKVAISATLCAAAAYASLQYIAGLLGLAFALFIGVLVYASSLRVFKAIPENDVIALADNLPSALPQKLASLSTKVLMLLVPSPNRKGL